MSSLDELEEKLYKREEERAQKTEEPAPLPPKFAEFKSKQFDPYYRPQPLPNIRKAKILSANIIKGIVIFIAVFVLGFFAYQKYFTGKDVILNVNAPKDAMVGEKFVITVNYNNQSKNVLENAKLILELPDRTVYLDLKETKRIVEIPLDDIGSGGRSSKNISLAIFGEPKTIQTINTSLVYQPSNFKKEISINAKTEISLSQPIITADINLPKESLNNIVFGGEITVKNNSNSSQKNIKIKAVFPLEFRFEKSEPIPNENNNVWLFSDLSAFETKKISFRGSISGKEKNFYKFEVKSSAIFNETSLDISKKEGLISISPSLIPLLISINDSDPEKTADFVAKLNEPLAYSIRYQNKTDIGLKDVIITAKFDTQMLDFAFLETNGYFDFKNNTITFNAYNTPQLSVIKANEDNEVQIRVKTKQNYPITTVQNKNFLIKLTAEVQTKSVPPYVDAPELKNNVEITNKVQGQTILECKMLYRDAGSKIINKGPMPFRAAQTTNLTIHWKIKNFSTDVSGIIITSGLPEDASWTNLTKIMNLDEADSKLIYDERTKIIKWEINKLDALRGTLDAAPEAIFQIAITPSVYDVGKSISLLGQSDLKARDEFTGAELTWNCPKIDNYSLMQHDPTVKRADVLP